MFYNGPVAVNSLCEMIETTVQVPAHAGQPTRTA